MELIIDKVVNGLLTAGTVASLSKFCDDLKEKFEISRKIVDSTIKLNGVDISQNNNGDILMSMEEYLSNINSVHLTKNSKTMRDLEESYYEKEDYRSLDRETFWLRYGV